MKVLVVTHKEDIDGMGPYILACLAYGKENVDGVFVDYKEKDAEIAKLLDSEEYLNYDKVLVTDLCPSAADMEKINALPGHQKRFVVLDHHQSNLDLNKFDFCRVIYEDQFCKECATNLFYEYLIMHNNFNYDAVEELPKNNAIDQFVELTRLSDTWEWKEQNAVDADRLSELFNSVKRDKYNAMMIEKLTNAAPRFEFSEEEQKIIAERMQVIKEAYDKALEDIKVIDADGVKVALVNIPYEFRSGFSQQLRDIAYPADLMAIADLKKRSMSYRMLSNEADAGQFAKAYGGGGSRAAAGSPLTDELAAKLGLKVDPDPESNK